MRLAASCLCKSSTVGRLNTALLLPTFSSSLKKKKLSPVPCRPCWLFCSTEEKPPHCSAWNTGEPDCRAGKRVPSRGSVEGGVPAAAGGGGRRPDCRGPRRSSGQGAGVWAPRSASPRGRRIAGSRQGPLPGMGVPQQPDSPRPPPPTAPGPSPVMSAGLSPAAAAGEEAAAAAEPEARRPPRCLDTSSHPSAAPATSSPSTSSAAQCHRRSLPEAGPGVAAG